MLAANTILLKDRFLVPTLGSSSMSWLTISQYLCHKWQLICSLSRNHKPVFLKSWLMTGFVTRVTGQVPLMQQEVFTLPEHMSSSYVLSGVRVSVSTINEILLLQLKCCRGRIILWDHSIIQYQKTNTAMNRLIYPSDRNTVCEVLR